MCVFFDAVVFGNETETSENKVCGGEKIILKCILSLNIIN